jgi:FHS family L-fucose permease-like MFS transporter
VRPDAAQAQNYNILAIPSPHEPFICTFILRYLNAGILLGTLAIGGLLLTLGAIFIQGMPGLYCLVGVSAACRSCPDDLRHRPGRPHAE